MAYTLLDEEQQTSPSGFQPIMGKFTLLEDQEVSRPKSLISAPIKGVIKGSQLPAPFNLGPVPAALGERMLERFLPTQKKGPEKFLEKAGELAPAIAIGPESLALKAAQLGGASALGTIAEKEGLGKFGTVAAELIGMSLPSLGKALGSLTRGLFTKKLAPKAGESAARRMKLKPSDINEGIRESANRLGVLENVPASAQIKNPKLQMIETRLMQSATGAPVQEKIEKLGKGLVEQYGDIAASVSKRENLLPSIVSQEGSSALKKLEEAAENSYRSLYKKAESYLPENAVTNPKIGNAIHRIIDSTLVKLKSALGTPAKDALFNRLTRLKESFSSTAAQKEGIIPVKELKTLKEDLNQVIKYELKGGVDKILVPLQNVVREGIQQYGKSSNPAFLGYFNDAEKVFGQTAREFIKNPLIRSLIKGENPEQIFSRMNTVKGINDLEKIFNKTAESKEVLDALKRYKLEDLLNKKVLDKNGNLSWGKAAGVLKEPKTRDLVLKLVGAKQYNRLKDLSRIASGVEEGFSKFLNTSKTATTAFDMGLLVGLPVKIVQDLFSFNLKGALKGIASFIVPGQVAKIISNPEFVEAAIATAKAGRGKDRDLFLKYATKVAQITASEMIQAENQNPQ